MFSSITATILFTSDLCMQSRIKFRLREYVTLFSLFLHASSTACDTLRRLMLHPMPNYVILDEPLSPPRCLLLVAMIRNLNLYSVLNTTFLPFYSNIYFIVSILNQFHSGIILSSLNTGQEFHVLVWYEEGNIKRHVTVAVSSQCDTLSMIPYAPP